MENGEPVQLLRALPLFEDLSDVDLAVLAQRVSSLRLPRGTVLTREGEVSEQVFQIRSGIVQVSCTQPAAETRFLTAGDVVGDRGLRTGLAETASAVAFTDVALQTLARREFEEVLRERPHVAPMLLRSLGARLERTDRARPGPESAPRARVLPVVSLETCVGRTTLAINVSAAIARLSGARVLLMDPSLTSTSITRALGISSDADYVPTLLRGAELDLSRVTWKTKGGFSTLLPPRRRGTSLQEPHLLAAFEAMAAAFDYLVVDSSSVFPGLNRTVLRAADRIVLVSPASPVRLEADRAQFSRTVLALNRIRPDRLVCVANQRADAGRAPAVADGCVVPGSAALLERCARDHRIALLAEPEGPFALAVLELACRLAFDHRLRVALPSTSAPDAVRASDRIGEFLKGRYAHVAADRGDPGGADPAADVPVCARAWATRDEFSRHMDELVRFLGVLKEDLGLPYVCLEIDGRPNLI
jgi:Mrp family chromosome partitioning ATPase